MLLCNLQRVHLSLFPTAAINHSFLIASYLSLSVTLPSDFIAMPWPRMPNKAADLAMRPHRDRDEQEDVEASADTDAVDASKKNETVIDTAADPDGNGKQQRG